MMRLHFRRAAPSLGLLAILALTWIAYRPGLAGGFLFDDFINLDALGKNGAISDWPAFWRYLTSGTADPLGRPLSLLSFLLDARDWPASPAAFLRTNVLLHLFNGALLFLLLRRLGAVLTTDTSTNGWAATLAAGLWVLHPLFVSTTLYAVQREAMLPATFVLIGLIAYTGGRTRFSATNGESGAGSMVAAILVGSALAALSKANGLLLPLLALALEFTVFARTELSSPARQRLRYLIAILLVLPSTLVLAYVAHFLGDWNVIQGERGWTIGQRVFTEARVLVTYLGLLCIPRSISTGIYNDDFLASQGLLQPVSTLGCLLLIGGLAWLAIAKRRSYPAWSAALLFFLAGHLLESSAVPLELYFEHRNYLPALLLFWPLARAVCAWQRPAWTRIAVAAGLIGLMAGTTYQRADLWGRPDALNALWLRKNPDSSRAQAAAAIALMESGRPDLAASLLRPIWSQRPDDLQIAVNYMDASCASGGLSDADKQALGRSIQKIRVDNDLLYRWLGKAVDQAATAQCPGMGINDVAGWSTEAARNPVVARFRSQSLDIESLEGRIALAQGMPAEALAHFDRRLKAIPLPSIALQQAAWLGSAGYDDQGLRHLDAYERLKGTAPGPAPGMPTVHSWILARQGYWQSELNWMRSRLHDDGHRAAGAGEDGNE